MIRQSIKTVAAILAAAAGLATGLAVAPAHGDEPAVGRLNHAGWRERMHCTATLIAPDRVLTAAHCVRGVEAAELHVLPGYDRTRWREDLRPFAAVAAAAPRDVAVLCLAEPAVTPPLPLSGTGPAPGERLVVIGYPSPGSTCRAASPAPSPGSAPPGRSRSPAR